MDQCSQLSTPSIPTRRLSPGVLLTIVVLLSGIITGITMLPVTNSEATQTDRSTATIANAGLRDQHGRPVTASDFENKLVLMNFFFTGCQGACPLQTAVLRSVREELQHSDEIVFLSVSIAPDEDTDTAIENYVKKYDLEQTDWIFSKTSADKLAKLIDLFGVNVNDQPDSNIPIDHRNIGFLFARNGQLMQQYQLVTSVSERLVREINELDQLAL